MNNKKAIIIIMFVALVALAVIFGIFKATHDENYLYDENGKIIDGKTELIDHLKSIEDINERKKQIDFSLQHNIITKEEANELY